MAIFSGKIVDAYYSNPEYTTVELLYEADNKQQEAGMKMIAHHLTVDENDSQFQDLLKEWSYEKIDEATKARNEQYRDEFHMAFHNYAMKYDLYGHGNMDEQAWRASRFQGAIDKDLIQGSLNLIFDFDPEDDKQKEDLFKLKLKMFEQPQVEKSKSKNLKSDIRKASTPLETILAYTKFK